MEMMQVEQRGGERQWVSQYLEQRLEVTTKAGEVYVVATRLKVQVYPMI
jgi:hypothetical protein